MKSKSVKRIFTLLFLGILVFSSLNFSACNSDRNKEIIEEPFDTSFAYINRWGSNEFTEIKDLKEYLTINHPNYTFLLIDTEDIDHPANPSEYQTFYQVHLNNEGAPYIVTNASIVDNRLFHRFRLWPVPATGIYYDWTYMMLSYPLEYTNEEISYKHYLVGDLDYDPLRRACYLMQDETIAAICIYKYAKDIIMLQSTDSHIQKALNKYTFYFQT